MKKTKQKSQPQAVRPRPATSARTNLHRAILGGAALGAFQNLSSSHSDDALTDLLTNLMHYCDLTKESFDKRLAMARKHYNAETDSGIIANTEMAAYDIAYPADQEASQPTPEFP